jgi:hypothetical protein
MPEPPKICVSQEAGLSGAGSALALPLENEGGLRSSGDLVRAGRQPRSTRRSGGATPRVLRSLWHQPSLSTS